jgi:hypothetical protein
MVKINPNSPKTVYNFFMVQNAPYFSKELKVAFWTIK